MNKQRLGFCVGLAIAVMAIITGIWTSIPDYRGDLTDFGESTRIYDCTGAELRVTLGRDELLCEPVAFEEVGEWSVRALVAFEDKRFYHHGGVDLLAIGRASVQNVVNRSVVSGASTLTTLTVKMTEPRPRTLWTKVVEAHHARQLEQVLTKDEILGQFINRAPFGGNVQGIEAASRRYFNKPASNLSLAESATLMGLPQSPSVLRPDRRPQLALLQRNEVLRRMRVNGFITAEQYESGCRQPLEIRPRPLPFAAPHFCDFMQQRFPSHSALHTTLDPVLQQLAETALRNALSQVENDAIHGGAVVVIEVKTGALRAMVGSPDFFASQVNGATARRSPGSTLKPFAYAAALDQGLYTPATLMADVPTQFEGYTPENYNREYAGPVSVRQALVQSLNIPAMRCVRQIGQPNFMQLLRALGFSTLDRSAAHYGISIAVGSCETTLLDLANAYACLARGGERLPLRCLQDDPEEEPVRIFSEAATYMIADILGGEERSAEFYGHRADVFLPRAAWKSGTSSGNRDAWTVAYNPEYVVGVWIGNPDGAPSERLVGGQVAAPVAGTIFRGLYPHGDSPWFVQPAELKTRTVCARSGLPVGPNCSAGITDFYIPRISPCGDCELHGSDGKTWPPELQAYMAERGRLDPQQANAPPRIESPIADTVFRFLSDVPGVRQEVVLSASGGGPFYWFVDGALYKKSTWALQRGTHVIACADALGRTDRVEIRVE